MPVPQAHRVASGALDSREMGTRTPTPHTREMGGHMQG